VIIAGTTATLTKNNLSYIQPQNYTRTNKNIRQ